MSALKYSRVPSCVQKKCADCTAKMPPTVGLGQSGFSLIEMMIVIAIIGVMVAVAAPNINSALERQRNKELSQTVASALKEARNEALFRHQAVKVEYTTTGLVVSQLRQPANTSESPIIRTYPIGQGGFITPDSDIVIFSPNKSVSFTKGDGKINTFCNPDGKVGRAVVVDKIGNIKVDTENSQC